MQLTHRFSVPGPVEETWERFADIADLAQCFPGAQVTSAEGDSFEGTVKVKLGPIALVYAGSGSFVSKDPATHTFVVEAKGRDKRGNGTAGATVTVAMSSADSAESPATDVQIETDLTITGKPAQFGRGVMQDVSDKLLAQFVACLEQRSASAPPGPDLAEPDPDAGPASVPSGAAAAATPVPDADAAPASAPAGAAATGAPAAPARHAAHSGPPADDAIDLGATVLPVLARSYWRQAAVGALGLLAAVLLVRRLRR